VSFQLTAFAQKTYVDYGASDQYNRALNLFNDQQYNAAQTIFDTYLQNVNEHAANKSSAEYYSALAAIYLFQSDGENRIKQFVDAYPNHPKALEAYFQLGNFYYREKNYAKAIQYYEKTNEKVLSKKELKNFQFKIGYSYFSRKAFQEALPYFNQLKRVDNQYQSAAYYYAGFINYELADYAQALVDLEKAEENDAYKASVAEMKANIFYQQGRFDEVINYVESLDGRVPSNIYLIAGDAFYALKEYDKAAEYFDNYRKGSNKSNNRAVLYRMGYAAFKVNQNKEAIELLEKVGIEKDSLTQFSTYYLGRLYQQENNSRYAINAYQQSKSLRFSETIAEESHWQLCLLLIDNADYSNAIKELSAFIEKYPSSSYATETKELLSQAYLNTNAYDLAIGFIESLPELTPKLKSAYQKVTFYQGADYFNQANFYQSVQSLKKSVAYPQSKELAGKAYFWMGEAYSTGKKYNEALKAYLSSLDRSTEGNEWYQNLLYGTAYAYYNTKQFQNALLYFKKYTYAGKKNTYFSDAQLRLADCYYVTKSYGEASATYQNYLRNSSDQMDYVYFQLGVVNALQNKNKEAFSNYEEVISRYKNSAYYDNALFQKALLTFESSNYELAVSRFKEMLNQVPQSNLVPYALSKRAIAYYNLKQYELALVDYKNILRNHITHPTANGALLGLQEIYGIKNEEGDFDQFLAAYKQANPNDKEVSSIEYDAAKSLYFNQNYSKASVAFKNYMENYPDNALAEEAKYYLADSYYRAKEYNNALPVFYEVLEDQDTPFKKRAVQKVAELELLADNYEKSSNYFNQLLKLAENARDQYNAWSGLLQLAKIRNNYADIIKYADLIINKGNVNTKAITEAYVSKGMAYFNQGKYEQAKTAFSAAIETAKDENAAEAKYMIALMQYTSEDYQTSINTLFELNNQFASFDQWLGKSFLLIADNYYALGELFQAKATLNSIIENASSAILIDEAKLKLTLINQEEQKMDSIQNASDSVMVTDTVKAPLDSIQD